LNAVLRLQRFAAAYSRSLVAYAIVAILWIAASLLIAGFGAYAHLRYIVELAAVIGLVGIGQTIAVIGGGDSAMEEALFLTRFASKVTLIHRRETFRASKIMLERAQHNPKIRFLTDTVVEDVYDPSKHEVTALKLKNLKTGVVSDFPASAMFLGIGHEPNAKMFGGQLETDADGYLKTHNYVMTRVHGAFACGDVQES